MITEAAHEARSATTPMRNIHDIDTFDPIRCVFDTWNEYHDDHTHTEHRIVAFYTADCRTFCFSRNHHDVPYDFCDDKGSRSEMVDVWEVGRIERNAAKFAAQFDAVYDELHAWYTAEYEPALCPWNREKLVSMQEQMISYIGRFTVSCGTVTTWCD